MVIARPSAHENHAGEERDPGGLAASQFVPQAKPEPRDSDQKKRDIGNDVPEIRNAEKNAPVGEFVILGILSDRRGREHQRDRPNRDDRQQKVPPAGLQPGGARRVHAFPLNKANSVSSIGPAPASPATAG